jgi:hypothetical protein
MSGWEYIGGLRWKRKAGKLALFLERMPAEGTAAEYYQLRVMYQRRGVAFCPFVCARRRGLEHAQKLSEWWTRALLRVIARVSTSGAVLSWETQPKSTESKGVIHADRN